ncbi:hypothetical protein PRUPE_2G268000 [Prunus persica]|uniref:4a-hydroxytetrahydrobiopterin dehydratase n=1 Tax=Prunus persica TaxID=3760 RepID=A0A251QM66_PRUPE|nr:hypothetical protein PRUPE_2G268000 [Prunus persica]
MATANLSVPLLSLPRHHHLNLHPNLITVPTRLRLGLRTQALGNDMLGDFGARDPFPAEIASGFGEKVLGNGNTEHKILIPNLSSLSLSQLDCSAVSPLQPPMPEDDAQKLLRKVVGWRLIVGEEAAGHFPNLHLEQPNQVRAELWTSSIGGLSMNDFIVAAKIDDIKTSDLVPRKRVWA